MEKKSDEKVIHDGNTLNDVESKITNIKTDPSTDNAYQSLISEKHDDTNEDKKEEEEEDEEEEEEEEDRIIEKSPNLRFHKRNKKYMRKVPGIDNSFIAIEPKSGKEVIWNEIQLSDKRNDQENRFINLIKKLKRYNHPFFVRFLDVWQPKSEGSTRKIIFITERLTDPTMKQYFVNSSSSQRITNKSLWRKFVGQLLSVLKFLNHLGVHHGNLSNETVYYQNTGCLKVGTLAVDLNFDNKSSSDIYDVGMLALEMTAYESADDAENLSAKDRLHRMLTRVADVAQCGFIQTCIDNSGEGCPSLTRLFQHAVLKEVPSLKRVAAKIIVQHSSTSSEEGKDEKMETTTQHSVFNSLIKDQVSHFEDETILFKVAFAHENITKLRLWKEFRVNFTNLPKYLEDVRNGFYPIFEGKADQLAEDGEDITFSYSMEQDQQSKDGNLMHGNGSFQCTVTNKDHFISPATSIDQPPEIPAAKDVFASELSGVGGSKDNAVSALEPREEVENSTVPGIVLGSGAPLQPPEAVAKTAVSEIKESPQPQPQPPPPSTELPKVDNIVVVTAVEGRRNSVDESKAESAVPEQVTPVVTGNQETPAEPATPYEDTNENEIDEDEDEEDDEDFNNGGTERIEPFWDYVSPPEKPPGDRALFTGCMYTYIGCGRWQIYVQIWFLEDRLKREVIIQVMEHDWSNDSQIASMFEAGKVISGVDKPVLERILGYARHNCPLIDGELIAPQQVLSSLDAYDLYVRLEHLQMFEKARQLLERAENEHYQQQQRIPPSPQVVVSGGSGLSSAAQSSVPHPTQMASCVNTPGENLQNEPTLRTPKASPLSESAVAAAAAAAVNSREDKAAILKNIKIGELPGFKMELMDIRILAPLNFNCMFCDNHDYMHNEELPPYLSSPCYHCREGLAKEAKISPASLFDLHQQNLVPWPAFLQVRYNMPPLATDGSGMTTKELIDYDCKWRGRTACRCYADIVLPPCVEFPNMYSDETTNVPYSIDEHFNEHHHSQATTAATGLNVTGTDVEGSAARNVATAKATTNVIYPCSNRHLKGATITCVHGVTFPRLAFPGPAAAHGYYKKVLK